MNTFEKILMGVTIVSLTVTSLMITLNSINADNRESNLQERVLVLETKLKIYECVA